MEPAIEVHELGKKFSRNQDQHQSYALKDLVRELMGRRPDPSVLRRDEFWAVENLSFAVEPGEAVALIGRNGSGKTTTLKMIAGLLKPDMGRILVRGRVQPLIALGSGFNPKLSGRENVYNNAAVLGFTRQQTNEIIDRIIEFAEIDEFLDSPVSTYSSGMKARLGFSVAVHLEPNILIVDEILGVGDFVFQNKCRRKIQELRRAGVTLLLVSHSHSRVLQNCDRAIWLHEGRLKRIGECRTVIDQYLEFLNEKEEREHRARQKKNGQKNGQKSEKRDDKYGLINHEKDAIEHVEATTLRDEEPSDVFHLHEPIRIRFSFELKERFTDISVAFVVYREDGQRMTLVSTRDDETFETELSGRVEGELELAECVFRPNLYVVYIVIADGSSNLYRDEVARFLVQGDRDEGLGLVAPRFAFRRLV